MGDTLATLVEEVQYELVQVASPASGQNYREHIKARIRREYRRLYHDHDWPHLIGWYETETQAGERYYDFPDEAALETTISIWRRWGDEWCEIRRGITPDLYNINDSDDDIRTDPIERWRPLPNGQVEFWPIPASNSLRVLFVAKRPFTQLVDEDDVCDLDTDLVVLHAAAQLARRYDADEASLILGRAQQHYATLKSRTIRGGNKVNLAGGPPSRSQKGFANKQIIGVVSGD